MISLSLPLSLPLPPFPLFNGPSVSFYPSLAPPPLSPALPL